MSDRAQGHFEAIKYAYRQSKDGFVLSFVVHPNDMPDVLANAPIGARYIIGFGRVDEKQEPGPKPQLDAGPAKDGEAPTGSASASPSPKPNSTRAVMMAKDEEFWRYLEDHGYANVTTADLAEQGLKDICDVSSKSDLNSGAGAHAFETMRQDFYAWRRGQ